MVAALSTSAVGPQVQPPRELIDPAGFEYAPLYWNLQG